mmetsp:Transcript_58750/g.127557  ORF Transcript_58750/g.127557 Transcript_58750/m.127557 type:complete len:211 (+) Transcript_58750:1160-1792(+)
MRATSRSTRFWPTASSVWSSSPPTWSSSQTPKTSGGTKLTTTSKSSKPSSSSPTRTTGRAPTGKGAKTSTRTPRSNSRSTSQKSRRHTTKSRGPTRNWTTRIGSMQRMNSLECHGPKTETLTLETTQTRATTSSPSPRSSACNLPSHVGIKNRRDKKPEATNWTTSTRTSQNQRWSPETLEDNRIKLLPVMNLQNKPKKKSYLVSESISL